MQDSTVFSNIEASEYIAELWKKPNLSAKKNLHSFENVHMLNLSGGI